MALVANTPAERAEQLALVTERLAALIAEETARIDARQPLAEGPAADEKSRLANAYRMELARLQQEPEPLKGAPEPLLRRLRESTTTLHEILARHEIALSAVRVVSEGLVQAMAEEVVRQQSGAANYSAGGAPAKPPGPRPAILDRSA
jgi:hypothetical protein